MNIAFRVDASIRIGTGHVMRCLALADLLRRSSVQVRFMCRRLTGNIIRVIMAQGFPVSELPLEKSALDHDDVPSPEWQDPEWRTDADQTSVALADTHSPVDWIIVDNYALAASWETRMRAIAKHIMVIDDLANRPHDCDALLDQNFNSGMSARYDKLIHSNCTRMLGPRYALLRPEFRVLRQNLRQRDGRIRRILVFFGGTDPGNETAKALRAIESLARDDITTDVVAGVANPNFDGLKAFCSRLPRIQLHREVPDMAELMANADLAIGAPGSTTWERCCLGLPTILISLAMNQESAAQALAKGGYAIYLGKSESVTADSISAVLRELFVAPDWVLSLSRACADLVDGRGTERALRVFDTNFIALHLAEASDCDHIYQWRNAEETRRYSHQTTAIPRVEHKQWFQQVLGDPTRILLIGKRGGQPVGVLRYDCEGSRCTVSIYLVPGQHGRGYGPRMLCAGHEWLKVNHPELKFIRAEVLPDNLASAEAFLQAGYYHDSDAYVKHLY
ncbi:MAG: UDP-2,4-diacetamido-2,4,6-trideoxy-beta-L-altropyranose hydrolase [Burkholderiales bacterium]